MPYKTCPQCGKLFYVPDPVVWAYKSNYKKGTHEVANYLCKWSCMLKFEKGNGIKRYGNRDGALFEGAGKDKEEDLNKPERHYNKKKVIA